MDNPKILSTTTVYRGRLFDIELTEMEMPNGARTAREGLIHPGAVAMVPVDGDGRLLLVTQYRHAAGRRLLEIPAGTLEKGEPPLDAAIRELQEEVGMYPGRIEPIGGIYVAPGYTSEYIHLYVCTELRANKLEGDHDEDIEVERLTPAEALAAIEAGRICDAKSVCGILRWMRLLNR
ncbi:MAG: NUDIX hydrolase [Dehalococcoidia bacterium]